MCTPNGWNAGDAAKEHADGGTTARVEMTKPTLGRIEQRDPACTPA